MSESGADSFVYRVIEKGCGEHLVCAHKIIKRTPKRLYLEPYFCLETAPGDFDEPQDQIEPPSDTIILDRDQIETQGAVFHPGMRTWFFLTRERAAQSVRRVQVPIENLDERELRLAVESRWDQLRGYAAELRQRGYVGTMDAHLVQRVAALGEVLVEELSRDGLLATVRTLEEAVAAMREMLHEARRSS